VQAVLSLVRLAYQINGPNNEISVAKDTVKEVMHMAFRKMKLDNGREIEVPKKYKDLTDSEKRGAKWGSMMTRNQVKERLGMTKPRDN